MTYVHILLSAAIVEELELIWVCCRWRVTCASCWDLYTRILLWCTEPWTLKMNKILFLAFPSFKFSYFPAYNVLSYLLNFYVYIRYLLSSFKLIRFSTNYFLFFFSTFRFIWPDAKDVRSSVFHFSSVVSSLLHLQIYLVSFKIMFSLLFSTCTFQLVSFKDVLFFLSKCGLQPHSALLFGLKNSAMNSSSNQRPRL